MNPHTERGTTPLRYPCTYSRVCEDTQGCSRTLKGIAPSLLPVHVYTTHVYTRTLRTRTSKGGPDTPTRARTTRPLVPGGIENALQDSAWCIRRWWHGVLDELTTTELLYPHNLNLNALGHDTPPKCGLYSTSPGHTHSLSVHRGDVFALSPDA